MSAGFSGFKIPAKSSLLRSVYLAVLVIRGDDAAKAANRSERHEINHSIITPLLSRGEESGILGIGGSL